MPSSKFNRVPVPRLRPPICIPPAGSCYTKFPHDDPPFLNAFADWLDLDPLDPTQASGYCVLDKIGPGRTYYGQALYGTIGVGAGCAHTGVGPLWDLTIYHLDTSRAPYSVTWSDIWIDPTRPFDSQRLHIVNIPGRDEQIIHIML